MDKIVYVLCPKYCTVSLNCFTIKLTISIQPIYIIVSPET